VRPKGTRVRGPLPPKKSPTNKQPDRRREEEDGKEEKEKEKEVPGEVLWNAAQLRTNSTQFAIEVEAATAANPRPHFLCFWPMVRHHLEPRLHLPLAGGIMSVGLVSRGASGGLVSHSGLRI
jgi:hypothetical protein